MMPNQTVDECESTNDLVKKMGDDGLPSGSWICARRQTQGRGRMGRAWLAEDGNLYFSMLIRLKDLKSLSWVPLVAAVATARAIRPLLKGRKLSIKWPNDLWLEQKKVGGILCEGFGSGASSYVVVGLGLNTLSVPQALDQPAASMGIKADEVRGPIIEEWRRAFDQLNSSGHRAFAIEYEGQAEFRPGVELQWSDGQSGVVIGLGDSGELKVRDHQGVERSLYSEEVSRLREEPDSVDWQQKLTQEQYFVLREKGTERPFTGAFWNHFKDGIYHCAGCGKPLFSAKTKFDAGCGWPSFWSAMDPSRVKLKEDLSHGMKRTEVTCAHCDGHLGHVFDDGPNPTGVRFCINSVSLEFEET